MTEVMLMVKCCVRKTTKKRPESAITTFRAIEDFINPLISAGFMTNLRHDPVFNKHSIRQNILFRFILIFWMSAYRIHIGRGGNLMYTSWFLGILPILPWIYNLISMDIAILSVSLNVYSSRRIAEEAQKAGHYVEQIDHTKCSVKLGADKPQIYLEEDNITDEFDAIVPRIGTTVTRHGAAIVKQFEMNDVFSTARSMGITRARNKVSTLQIMAKKGIPIPQTVFSINPDNVGEQIELLGGPPVIIKLQEGTQGKGVILAESKKSAKSMIDTLYNMNTGILLQEFIEEANGEELRVIVVGNRVVAGMKRTSSLDEIRSNVHRGADTDTVKLTQREKFIALSATKILGLGVAGVDLIRSKDGPLLIEVN